MGGLYRDGGTCTCAQGIVVIEKGFTALGNATDSRKKNILRGRHVPFMKHGHNFSFPNHVFLLLMAPLRDFKKRKVVEPQEWWSLRRSKVVGPAIKQALIVMSPSC